MSALWLEEVDQEAFRFRLASCRRSVGPGGSSLLATRRLRLCRPAPALNRYASLEQRNTCLSYSGQFQSRAFDLPVGPFPRYKGAQQGGSEWQPILSLSE
jgi:hypothetical protein